eukprot:TRINITY_DN158_c1_g1_i1.p1 TRINITY_DN158_c1_g1~~TRINITY_DN158_c1_g1_i1.p1  ORF type:complete len:369 (-),score=37.80 TRINITY_DN158_c1_g1_i1:3358-4464(-)
MLNNNISESIISLLTQQSQHKSLNLAAQSPQVSINQISELLAMSMLSGGSAGDVKVLNSRAYNQSPRDHITQNNLLPHANVWTYPLVENQNTSAPVSHTNPQQFNNQINNLPHFNHYAASSSNKTQFAASNFRNSAVQPNRQRDQNPRKVRQQQQFSANKNRTIYITEVHPDTTEADIAILFSTCGEVIDCRLCGDAHSKMRFAFVEFSVDHVVSDAIKLNNTLLCGSHIRVQRSKTAIVPIKRDLLPQNQEEMIRCGRTVYVCNIDKRFNKTDVQAFFEALAVDASIGSDGKVLRIKMMGDSNQKTNIAFVEFCSDESTASAINKCQGALMGCLPLRIFPSKTPIRSAEEERELKKARQTAALRNQN